jgi:toxin FitB
MLVLDTNVISEVMRPQPSPAVLVWLNQQQSSQVYITTISIAEIGYGLRILADGQRRRLLQSRFDQFIGHGFDSRILDFDRPAAEAYAEIMAFRKEIGSSISFPDAQIAAITWVSRFILATRNTKDFEQCGIGLINPFE